MSTRISLSKSGSTPLQQLIGHNQTILDNWTNLESTFYTVTHLEKELLEEVRKTLAFGNQCEYCMKKAGKPNEIKENQREKLATAFAELFAIDHLSIKVEHFAILRDCFTDVEISELCSFISFITASQKLGRIFNLQ
ncbi:carboxymuconolactone decarboxylase family protein [Xanthovirga aplysinae]|uniref:carboxymuconolactone decarboxylase family protein n=1 Tax=Xanthovirga aplysinae TaxID=2529853 RepID=UPI0012BBA457|nr:carboxymuconolactone decarboxylase family protein [Xanthovirga aplysinae]MTI31818.1 carboxymuconolactone decarboxylase family protein [Xanthovirga aplysinae]